MSPVGEDPVNMPKDETHTALSHRQDVKMGTMERTYTWANCVCIPYGQVASLMDKYCGVREHDDRMLSYVHVKR